MLSSRASQLLLEVEVKNAFLVIMFVLATAAVTCVAQTPFESALKSTARKCQSTFHSCIQQSANLTAMYNAKTFCDIFTKTLLTDEDTLPFHCLVSNGLCTEDEFDALGYAACGKEISDFVVSEYENHFYTAIDATSPTCQDRILFCINISAVATVLKQEEEYCRLLQLNINGITSASCLSDKCSPAEFLVLKVAACDIEDEDYEEVKEESFGDILFLTNYQCQGAIENCIDLLRIRDEEYCEALNTDGVKTCMGKGCSSYEITILEIEACEEKKAVEKISQMCSRSIETCAGMSKVAQYYYNVGEYCSLFNAKFKDVSAYQCLVDIGFCTQDEYNLLKYAFCDDIEQDLFFSYAFLFGVIEGSNEVCQKHIVKCIMQSIIATVLKSDDQYCELMNLSTNGLSANDCLVGCSENDKLWFRKAACNTALTVIKPSPFTKAVLSTSPKCKDMIERCSFGSDLAFSSIQSKQYCKIMNIYQSGAETYACLLGSGGCTLSEYQAMTDAACENELLD